MDEEREIEECLLIIKIAVVGIVVLAIITAALMPSPGNHLNSQAESKLTRPSKSTGAAVQVSAQDGLTSEAAIETSTQLLTPPAVKAAIETVPGPVYTNVTILPENVAVTVNQTFSVEVWINNVTDMAGWQIMLLWDRNVLKCVQAQVNTPPEWGGVALDFFNKTEADVANIDPVAVYTAWQFAPGIENYYNSTCGRYAKAECRGPRGGTCHNTFNGSVAVVTLTFQAIQAGSTSLDFSRDHYDVVGRYYEGMIIGDGNAKPIAHIDHNGSVKVQEP